MPLVVAANNAKPITGREWRFLPPSALRVAPALPHAVQQQQQQQQQQPAASDLESQYSSFLDNSRQQQLLAGTGDDPILGLDGEPPLLRAQVSMPLSTASGPQGTGDIGGSSGMGDIIPSDPDVLAVVYALSKDMSGAEAEGAGSGAHEGRGETRHGLHSTAADEQDAAARHASHSPDDDAASVRETAAPVIVWDRAAQVRIVTDLPPELRPTAPLADSPARSLGRRSSSLGQSGGPPQASRRPPFGRNRRQPRSNKLPFGAWYLPSEAWGKDAPPHDGEAALQLAHVRDPTALSRDRDSAAEAAAASVASKLTSLYSSRMYKEFLKQNNARIPSYLQRVETPKASTRPKASAFAQRAREAAPALEQMPTTPAQGSFHGAAAQPAAARPPSAAAAPKPSTSSDAAAPPPAAPPGSTTTGM